MDWIVRVCVCLQIHESTARVCRGREHFACVNRWVSTVVLWACLKPWRQPGQQSFVCALRLIHICLSIHWHLFWFAGDSGHVSLSAYPAWSQCTLFPYGDRVWLCLACSGPWPPVWHASVSAGDAMLNHPICSRLCWHKGGLIRGKHEEKCTEPVVWKCMVSKTSWTTPPKNASQRNKGVMENQGVLVLSRE